MLEKLTRINQKVVPLKNSVQTISNCNNCKKRDLILPHQPYHDEFLDIMTKVFHWSRWVGVVGLERIIWKLWGVLLLLLFLILEGGAIVKVIKALAGWAIDIAGHRSVTARVSGAMFYAAAMLGLIQCWRLSSSWKELRKYWSSVERVLSIKYIPSDTTLKRRMYKVIGIVAVCTIFEHILNILSFVDFYCQPSRCFRKYILASHGFLILESEYTDWIAVPVLFMSIIATILWNLWDTIIILISMGLTSRYWRLNKGVAKVTAMNRQENKISEDSKFLKIYLWRKIREAYVKQSMLVRRVDESLGGIILLSTFFNFYFLCLQLFLGVTQGLRGASLKEIYYLISLIWLSVRTGYAIVAAADVSKHSTLALPYLYECNGSCYNIEIERLQKQLNNDFVALSGKDFFYLNRTVILRMSGAVVTYVLVLVQYDNSDPDTDA